MALPRYTAEARRIWNNLDHFGKIALPVFAKKWGFRGIMLVNVACAAHLFAENVGWAHMVSGPSMLPTMGLSGKQEWIIESRLISPQSLSRGDLVIFTSPLDPTRTVCKRLIGLPGDTVCVDPTGKTAPSTEHVIIPKGHVWLSGDNAEMSRDSRVYGPVSMALIKGKLIARIWPLGEACIFNSNFSYLDD